jgi:hypothetical protein
MYWVRGTGKLISISGFFPCLLLSAKHQAHVPLVIVNIGKGPSLQETTMYHIYVPQPATRELIKKMVRRFRKIGPFPTCPKNRSKNNRQ